MAGASAPTTSGTRCCTPTRRSSIGLWATWPHTQLTASGEAVGLPAGQMGNSEVGHLNLGAGFVVYQWITFIDKEIAEGRFFQNAGAARRDGGGEARRRDAAPARPDRRRRRPRQRRAPGGAAATGPRSAGVDRRLRPRLPRRPRHAAAERARLHARPGGGDGRASAPAGSRRSPAATTRWTATSAGTALEQAYDALVAGRGAALASRDGGDRGELRRRRHRRVHRSRR